VTPAPLHLPYLGPPLAPACLAAGTAAAAVNILCATKTSCKVYQVRLQGSCLELSFIQGGLILTSLEVSKGER
jgi:hypothetical protein